MIASTNSALDKAIKHIELNTELTTLAELVRYGIEIDESILLTDEERFAGLYNPINSNYQKNYSGLIRHRPIKKRWVSTSYP
jgi:hypothetical protein